MPGRSLAAGLLAALLTCLLVLGGLSISLAEAQRLPVGQAQIPVSSPTNPVVLVIPTQTSLPPTLPAVSPSPTASPTASPAPTRTPTKTALPSPTTSPTPAMTSTLAPCAQPQGWIVYTIVPGDYLAQIAYTYQLSLADLRRVNCLGRSSIIHPGDTLFVPPLPKSSATPLPSGTIPPTKSS